MVGLFIVDSGPLYAATLLLHVVLYFIAPIFFFSRRLPFLAGVTMVIATVLPILGQASFTDSDMPGSALLLLVEAPIAIMVFGIGVVQSVKQRIRRSRMS